MKRMPTLMSVIIALLLLAVVSLVCFKSSVHSLEKAGRYEPLLILNFTNLDSERDKARLVFSILEKDGPLSERERLLSQVSGQRTLQIAEDLRLLYNSSSEINLDSPSNKNTSRDIRMTLFCNGRWSQAKVSPVGKYVKFFPDNVSSSFRILEEKSLPIEVRKVINDSFEAGR